MQCQDIVKLLDALSPKKYACDWDNVGLLVGRRKKEVHKILVALDASKEVISYAVENGYDMLVTHHPMIFSSVKKVNEDDFVSEKILTLAEHQISYYAMHTNFDAVGGMADLAAGPEYLNLSDTSPIDFCDVDGGTEGMGRYGKLPQLMTAKEVAELVKEKFHMDFVMLYQSKEQKDKKFDRIAVMPGAGKSEMQAVKKEGYDLYLTGDYGHHSGLDAMDMGMTVIDATHFGLEHIFIEYIENYLKEQIGDAVIINGMKQTCPVQVL